MAIIYIIIILLTLYLFFVKRKKSAKEVVGIPGPPQTSEEFGNIPDIIKAGSMPEFLDKMHTEYGPIFNFRIKNDSCISTYSPEDFRSQAKLSNKPENTMEFIIPIFGDKGIHFVNGKEARERRQAYDREMTQSMVAGYIPSMQKIVDDVAQKWRLLPEDTDISLYEQMFSLACKATGINLFGEYFEDDKNVEEYRKLYEKFWPMLETNLTQGLPPEGTDERKEFGKVSVRIKEIAAQLKADRLHAHDRKFIDVAMETCPDAASAEGDIITYLVAGFHSTSIALTWAIYHSCKLPEVKSRIQQEVASVVTSGDGLDKTDIEKFVYIRHLLDEVLRIHFIAPITTRAAEDNLTLHGHTIPAGTHLFHALSMTLNDPTIWSQPERFNPDRFISDQGKNRPRLAHCPFGFAGKRICPGPHFFYAEATVFLSTLFREFDIRLKSDDEIDITYGLLTRPTKDIRVYIKSRK